MKEQEIVARDVKVEMLSRGRATMLVRDGVILLDELGRAAISREQPFAMLRGKQEEHLAGVLGLRPRREPQGTSARVRSARDLLVRARGGRAAPAGAPAAPERGALRSATASRRLEQRCWLTAE